jgi:hypothetical protein
MVGTTEEGEAIVVVDGVAAGGSVAGGGDSVTLPGATSALILVCVRFTDMRSMSKALIGLPLSLRKGSTFAGSAPPGGEFSGLLSVTVGPTFQPDLFIPNP